jgi:zeaxanthin epoxidase
VLEPGDVPRTRAEVVAAALQDYYRTRIVRTATVQVLSRMASDLIINLFDTPWSPHDARGTDWKSYLTFFWKPILQYVVFPAQFLYLYSFAPSGKMGALPAQLEASWLARHRAQAESAFAGTEAVGSGAGAVRAKASFISD